MLAPPSEDFHRRRQQPTRFRMFFFLELVKRGYDLLSVTDMLYLEAASEETPNLPNASLDSTSHSLESLRQRAFLLHHLHRALDDDGGLCVDPVGIGPISHRLYLG
jgi:hypothetical protein